MPIVNRIAEFAGDMKTWRRHLHTIPELGFDCPKTAAFIEERLGEIGVDEIHTGIAQTGIVAIIEGQGAGPTIGLRADFDALPIEEATGLDYASTHPGKMHACGHDGHTAMLLGAAKYLAETRNFAGRVALVFQPAEEAGGGAGVMVDEGIMDRFEIAQIYGIHNAPRFTEGGFYTTPGPIMAAVDTFHVDIQGVGGHGAMPHETRDPVMAACGIATAIQTIERNYPATINHADCAAHAAEIAAEVSGADKVVAEAGREMGAEDFAYMLQARPGAYLFLGQGESAGLHHPEYNFNDDVAPVGASFFARLVERTQPVAEG